MKKTTIFIFGVLLWVSCSSLSKKEKNNYQELNENNFKNSIIESISNGFKKNIYRSRIFSNYENKIIDTVAYSIFYDRKKIDLFILFQI